MKPQRAKAPKVELAAIARASCANPRVTLRAAGGGAISDETRDEMLRRCAAGEYVELELDVLAFEQKPGVQNRNFVRFRDGALMAMGRTGVGTPFMRDHDQYDSMARGGTVIASQTEKLGEGDYAIRQTVKLTATWAVELALRGLLSTVSIGWDPKGAVLCSVCNANFYRCSHYPGECYVARDDEGGNRVFMRDPNGPLVCEVVYTGATLVETSGVPVPAVPAASIQEIRASLAHNGGEMPHGDTMNPELLALLGLAATAGDTEVLTAVKKFKGDLAAAAAKLSVVEGQFATANAELEANRAAKRKADEDKLFADATASGRVAPGSADETSLRAWHALAPEEAAAHIAARKPGTATPAGAPRQLAPTPPEAPRSQVDAQVQGLGLDAAYLRHKLAEDHPGLSAEQLDNLMKRTTARFGRA